MHESERAAAYYAELTRELDEELQGVPRAAPERARLEAKLAAIGLEREGRLAELARQVPAEVSLRAPPELPSRKPGLDSPRNSTDNRPGLRDPDRACRTPLLRCRSKCPIAREAARTLALAAAEDAARAVPAACGGIIVDDGC